MYLISPETQQIITINYYMKRDPRPRSTGAGRNKSHTAHANSAAENQTKCWFEALPN